MIYQLGTITFAAFQYVWFAPIIIFLSALCIYRLFQIRVLASYLSDARLMPYMLKNFSFVRQIIKTGLLIAGFFLLFVALLRPQWGTTDNQVVQYGRDVYIALDVSRSMAAQDIQPNRLEYAKQKIRALIERLHSERVGLIIFSGSACVLCPLTTDRNALYLFLDTVDTQALSSGTTALAEAITRASQAFAGVSERKHKLLLLVTDGEDFSKNVTKAYHDAACSGVMLLTLGMATEDGAPVPLLDEQGAVTGYQKNEQGSVVISRLNSSLLEKLAHESGGVFVRATEDTSDIAKIMHAVEQVEREQAKSNTVISGLEERYWYFVVASFLFLLVSWLL